MKYKVAIRYCVKVEAKNEEEAIDKGYSAFYKEFSLTEHQLALSICNVKKAKQGGKKWL